MLNPEGIFPVTILVDRDGVIVHRVHGYGDEGRGELVEKVEALLGGP